MVGAGSHIEGNYWNICIAYLINDSVACPLVHGQEAQIEGNPGAVSSVKLVGLERARYRQNVQHQSSRSRPKMDEYYNQASIGINNAV